jgi:uncharacterized protein YdaT
MAWPKPYLEQYQYLSDDTHRKAGEIASDLLRQGMPKQEALRTAYRRAINWSRRQARGGQPIGIVVAPCDDGWSVRSEGSDQAAMTFPTKQEALHRAYRMAQAWEADVVVQGQEGEVHGRDG